MEKIFDFIRLFLGLLQRSFIFIFNRYTVGATALLIFLSLIISIADGKIIDTPRLIFLTIICVFIGLVRCILDVANEILDKNKN